MTSAAPRVLTLPGVYRPRSDSHLLAGALAEAHACAPGGRWLDVCTGTGVAALTAARLGARDVTAIDRNPWAARNARLNARLHRAKVRVLCGDLFAPVHGERFDVVVSNPPYLPADPGSPAAVMAWDAGPDGREVLDRLCLAAPGMLTRRGMLLLVQSSLAGTERSAELLREGGLRVTEVARHEGPLGPIAAARRDVLGTDRETLVVLRAVAGAARPMDPGPAPQLAVG